MEEKQHSIESEDDSIKTRIELKRKERAMKTKNRVLTLLRKKGVPMSIYEIKNEIDGSVYSSVYEIIKDLEGRKMVEIKKEESKGRRKDMVKLTPHGINSIEEDTDGLKDRDVAIYTITDKDALGI